MALETVDERTVTVAQVSVGPLPAPTPTGWGTLVPLALLVTLGAILLRRR